METPLSPSFFKHKLAKVDALLSSSSSFEEFYANLHEIGEDGYSIENFVQSYLATSARPRPTTPNTVEIEGQIVQLYVLLGLMTDANKGNVNNLSLCRLTHLCDICAILGDKSRYLAHEIIFPIFINDMSTHTEELMKSILRMKEVMIEIYHELISSDSNISIEKSTGKLARKAIFQNPHL